MNSPPSHYDFIQQALFSSYFGHEWSEKFLYEFLFEDAVPVAVHA